MSKDVNFYGIQYGNFVTDLYQDIRNETYDEDIGQNGWLTAEEHDMFIEWLTLKPEHKICDIACGSGGPSLRIVEKTGCILHGLDINEDGIETAKQQTKDRDLSNNARFHLTDGSKSIPFESDSFDSIICIDAINHLPNRSAVLKEWNRILKKGGKLLFTDPITVTGTLTKEDVETRASIGYFLFVADGVDEKLLKTNGFRVLKKIDRTANMVSIAKKWKEAREKRSTELLKVEGKKAFYGQQTFLEVCAKLGDNKDLSRFAILSEKI